MEQKNEVKVDDEESTGVIDGVSFDTRLSLVDNIANLVTKEKQVLLLQLEEKTRQLERVQTQLNDVQSQYNKLETYVSDQNEDTHTAWQRAGKQSKQSQRASLATAWFGDMSSIGRGGGPLKTNATQTSLSRLVLAHQPMGAIQLATLRKQVPLLPQLTSLDLTRTGLTDDDAPSVADFFSTKCGLKEIILSDNNLDLNFFKSVNTILKTPTRGGNSTSSSSSSSSSSTSSSTKSRRSGSGLVQLERLDLSRNPFARHPKIGGTLGDTLKQNTTLSSLTITLDDVATLRTSRGSSYLGNATQLIQSMYHSPTAKNTTLRELRLVGATLSSKTMEALGKGRGLAFKTLQCLDLSSSLLGPTGIHELVVAIMHVRPRRECVLSKLCLRGNSVGDQGASELGLLLRTNRTLTYIDVRGNQIGERGAISLGSALERDDVVVASSSSSSSTSSSSRMSERRSGRRDGGRRKRSSGSGLAKETRTKVVSVIKSLFFG